MIMQNVPATSNESFAEKLINSIFTIGGLISLLALIAQMFFVEKFTLMPLPKF